MQQVEADPCELGLGPGCTPVLVVCQFLSAHLVRSRFFRMLRITLDLV